MHRVITAGFLFYLGFGHMNDAAEFALVFPRVIGGCAGFLLLLGLWTPICGTSIAVAEVWIALALSDHSGVPILLAASGATLAMIGPGAWSVDARLFGRKHFEIQQR
ncbi:hypothetical protein ACPOL_3530 [Acidisarcina polymorpha]|uniref:DoxX family protein n=1 Tax=Acidisarcina polymorpha TaxID=2211140 RepID=A0A2Z5G2C4_9BACT|nr:hypothetical protein ACPOL_3530 [Acidisarcina polymorpha]